jgi:hypothetical protein
MYMKDIKCKALPCALLYYIISLMSECCTLSPEAPHLCRTWGTRSCYYEGFSFLRCNVMSSCGSDLRASLDSLLQAGFLLGLFFDPEDSVDFHQAIWCHIPKYRTLTPSKCFLSPQRKYHTWCLHVRSSKFDVWNIGSVCEYVCWT